jgi:hypothetical protein
MAVCSGKRKSGATCNSTVYRCDKCVNVGCDQVHAGECSNQGFRLSMCLKCGAINLKQDMGRLVMMPQLQQAIRVLRLSLPVD